MKALFATTCIAILAAIAYYGIGEYRQHAAEQEQADRIEGARAELYKMAGAQPGAVGEPAVKAFCETMEEGIKGDLKDNEVAKGLAHNCRVLGYL
ncbi:hypothetical protein QO002_006195 [Pararhizobium capsulatum DSM 1112]|uniref:Uncharacterized protein n=1 Tax=Pararhizobium capsulatum DSM 1112 TaxID=1121113 RepID=A0ABU0C0D7_9HYPH|nr:hypothetical protein [Pararhizobium capsulatum]MDQ0323988.1 hypothetical protein [Pararhizobium capsulatum DSM 1112]